MHVVVHAVEVTGSEVVFRNVSFSYPLRTSIPVLQQVDLSIQPGQRIAIVGGASYHPYPAQTLAPLSDVHASPLVCGFVYPRGMMVLCRGCSLWRWQVDAAPPAVPVLRPGWRTGLRGRQGGELQAMLRQVSLWQAISGWTTTSTESSR